MSPPRPRLPLASSSPRAVLRFLAAASVLAAACASSTIPRPEDALEDYASAAAKGDADAIYSEYKDGLADWVTRSTGSSDGQIVWNLGMY